MDRAQVPWWQAPASDAVQQLLQIEREYCREYSWRREEARRLGALYHGLSPHAGGPVLTDGETPIRNKFFEYTETLVGKVAGIGAPRPALMVTDGDWELKRQVTLAGRLLEAEYDRSQGHYANIHAMGCHGLRLVTTATGSVAAKVYPWPKEDRVVVELHDTLDMFLDDSELPYGSPRTFGEVTWWPAHRLQANYPQHAAAIEGAQDSRKPRGGLGYLGRANRARLVPVWEAWAMAVAGEEGRHLVFLEDGTVLSDEPWPHAEPPFAFLHASPSLVGFWGIPLLRVVEREAREVNRILRSCIDAHTHTPRQVHYVVESQVQDINELLDVDDIMVVRLKTTNGVVRVDNPPPFNRMDLELLHEHEEGIARVLGIDEMHSAARAQPGLPSAVAQRAAGQRFDNRFSALHRAYSQWIAVDIGRLVLHAQRALYDGGKAFKRRWTGEFFSRDIQAKDIVDLELNALHLQVKEVSETRNTPEARLQYAEELLERGLLPYEAYLAAQQNYDAPSQTRVLQAQRRWVAWQVDQWLFAEDEERSQPGFFQGPRPWTKNKQDVLAQVLDALMEAELSGVPDDRLQYFLDFIAELTAMMAPAAPAAPAVSIDPSALPALPAIPE